MWPSQSVGVHAVARPHLHEAHAALHQPPRQQAAAAEIGALSGSSRPYSFFVASDSLLTSVASGRRHLHPKRELVGRDARGQFRIVIARIQVLLVQLCAACRADRAARPAACRLGGSDSGSGCGPGGTTCPGTPPAGIPARKPPVRSARRLPAAPQTPADSGSRFRARTGSTSPGWDGRSAASRC